MSATPAASRRALRLGTRGSALARLQSEQVADALRARGHAVEIVAVVTAGDVRPPDTAWGEGAFVGALEHALLCGEVDLAVHSAKDVPIGEDRPGDRDGGAARARADGAAGCPEARAVAPATDVAGPSGAGPLVIAAYPWREDPRDALVLPASRAGTVPDAPAPALLPLPAPGPIRCGGLDADLLPSGSRVGTDSPRRAGFLRAARPDLEIVPLHGNVDTRLRRLDDGNAGALVLAVAGLLRLGHAARISCAIDPELVPPAPAQGALAVQCRSDDGEVRAALAGLDDPSIRLAVETERAVLRAAGGGCRAPLGAFATVSGGVIDLVAGAVAADGRATMTRSSAPEAAWRELAESTARALLRSGYPGADE